ncbi:DUF309 domain-containing protein [Haloferax namakaokahaiae]|uniref:DUF309 domain-containing protein n=1 Tax=Haloferax namakaokahaiae TaxID=1748331 RepID=A0ABD5ZH64_9EURY
MDDALRAGAAIYNAGAHRAAHGAWESVWLTLDKDSDDERLLHGLIQFTAAVHHAHAGNVSGATGLATSAQEYLDGLDEDYRGLNLADVRDSLERLESDPEQAVEDGVTALYVDGVAVTYDDLDFDAIALAAETLAEELSGYDDAVVEDAIDYARDEISTGVKTQFTAMVFDFVGDETHRPLVYQRLCEHVDRKRQRESDVSGLFD